MPCEVNARVEGAMTQSTKIAIAQRYRRFGSNEARGLSPLYEMLSAHIAESEPVLTFLARLPVDRQQPNLFFAALRMVARRVVSPVVVWQGGSEADRRALPTGAVAAGGFAGGHR